MIDLETSEPVNPDMRNTSSRLVIHKRRSSIFQRRSINPRQQDYDETISEKEKSTNSKIVPLDEPQEKIFDLSEYISSLLDEQRAWKKTLNERKFRRKCLTKEEARVREGVEFDLSPLTDREKIFISERPKYEAISENMQNLLKVAVNISMVNIQVNRMHKTMAETLNKEISRAKTQLIDLSGV
ncbi:uncharacterized protein LOC107038858 [Diachasma alloeum]|uniref:uncharacterized protein LOC107038858 n=1 Tax=Diachasma alloeum TaxID=454923 RepID=UPI0007385190|nr:uncharacterized protein LOC107038858 [Diachasma alloeum]